MVERLRESIIRGWSFYMSMVYTTMVWCTVYISLLYNSILIVRIHAAHLLISDANQ